jgi:hypothetical protein
LIYKKEGLSQTEELNHKISLSILGQIIFLGKVKIKGEKQGS